MATKKNAHTKKAAPKKTTWKKVKSRAKAKPLTWRFYVVTIGIFTIAVCTMIVIALLTANAVARQEQQARLDRIQAIYSSFELTDEYLPVRSDVFGDKRVYRGDTGRTAASTVEYLRGDTVTNTVADLDAKIKAAGFTLITDDTSDNGMIIRYHYKSAKDEYVRLTVVSKPLSDTWENSTIMNRSSVPAMEGMDTNAGPALATVKVNLDDNNE